MSKFVSLDSKARDQLRTTAIVAADYLINVLILFAFAAIGTIPYDVAVRILLAALAFNVIFLGGIAAGLAQRFSATAGTGVQIVAACGINLLGLLYAPQIAYMFIVNLFAPLAYGSLHFNKRMFLHTWILLSCALAGAMLTVGAQAAIAYESVGERLLFWGVISIALGRFLAVHAEISRVRVQLQVKHDELIKTSAALADLASRDALTGLWNRREFMRLLHDESRRAVRNRLSFCVALISLDNFKAINESVGHLAGDTVLHEFAQFLEVRRRATDAVARYDGTQFALLLAGARLSTAMVALERTRYEIAQQNWQSIVPGMQLSIAAGVAAWQPGETLISVIGRAEAALDGARKAGGNCVRVSTPVQPVIA